MKHEAEGGAGASTTNRPLLRVRGLHAGHDGVAVVRGLDLEVGAGRVVALLGPNGAGKTTTLRTVSGLLPVISGSVEVLGGPPSARAPHRVARRGVGHVTEDRSLFFDLTARQNLRLALPARSGRRARQRAVDGALGLFGELAPHLDRRAGLLSGGQQQMLALARALVAEPRLLLVDEMSLGLAPVIVARLLPMVRRVADEHGVGVLLVEQHPDLALAVADTAVVLVHGEVAVSGPAEEVAGHPEVLHATYLGG